MPEKTFDEALMELLDTYADTPADELISALELQIYALKEAE